MLKFIENAINNWKNKKEDRAEISEIDDTLTNTMENIFSENDYVDEVKVIKVDLETFDDPNITNPKGRKTFLFMDDIEESDYLFTVDFSNIKKDYGYDIYKELKIVKCYGNNAGFIADKYITNNPKIDYAVLDITLGSSIKLASGQYIEYDGVDIALKILENNPKAKILFCTAHTLNRRNPLMQDYINKFEENTNLVIDNFYLNKNDDRVTAYAKFLRLKRINNG